MPRGIDHLVLAVRDLDAAAQFYERLGFTLTPLAQHPFGTGNRLAQLQGCFLELLAVTQPKLITEVSEGNFSFGAYNRDFLEGREGLSMIALQSANWKADRANFQHNGLDLPTPFWFSRMATQPDGSEVEMGFDLTFVPRAEAPEAMFFTCCHRHAPEHFYKPDYQMHANGAKAIRSVSVTTDDAVRARDFLMSLEFDCNLFDVSGGSSGPERLAGYEITVENLEVARNQLESQDIPYVKTPSSLVVAADDAFGAEITFCEESDE